MSYFGTTDILALDSWSCLFWLSKPEYELIYLHCGGKCNDCASLRSTSGGIPADLFDGQPAVSTIPKTLSLAEVRLPGVKTMTWVIQLIQKCQKCKISAKCVVSYAYFHQHESSIEILYWASMYLSWRSQQVITVVTTSMAFVSVGKTCELL